MNIIMMSGLARVGKTWLANVVAEYSFNKGQVPVLLSFADAIKEIALENNLTKEDNPEEYRKLCQELGSKKRSEDPDYWVKIMLSKIKEEKAKEIRALEVKKKHWERVIIIDDARYMNELGLGRSLGAVQIFVSCGKRRLEEHDADWRNDVSESLAKLVEANDKNYEEIFHYFLVNEETKEGLVRSISQWLPVWCGLESKNLWEDDCDCELCVARRTNKELDVEKVIDDFLEELIKRLEGEEDDEDPEQGNT
jgi:hypothetical protein